MEEEHEYAAVQTAEEQAALRVQEGEDIDFRIILGFYIVADIIFVLLYIFAKEEGYWVVPIPFLPLTVWMGWKVWKQRSIKAKKD
mmetsp:Transcript_33023/g.77232  ORF Transcript_33023/g.77232 Transcript_33023/m.77232 type:complete len:85 (+) Transcript_33023:217-471(+)